jgi:hypothetical protein
MKRRFRQRVVLSGSIILAVICWGQNAYCETAMVLPQGRSRFSFIYAETDGIDSQFTAGGTRESITQPYNMPLDAQTLRSAEPAIKTLVDDLNSTKDHFDASKQNAPYHGISPNATGPLTGDALDRGYLNVNAEAHREQYVASYQYGLTNHLTVGFAVPMIKMQVTGNATITGDNTASAISSYYQSNGKLQPIESDLKTLASISKVTLQDLLTSHGYSDATSWNQDGIGDVVLGARYNYLNSYNHLWLSSIQFGASAPTGQLKDPSEPLAVDFGQGAWDLEVANIFNYSPTAWLTFSNSLHYGHHLKSDRELRVASPDDSFLPTADDQEDVTMQLGDKYEINLGTDIKLMQGLTFSTSYDWFWKGQDVYSGTSDDKDYSALSYETNEYVTTAQAGLSYSTIPSFLKSEFPAPVDIALNVYVPTGGRNAIITPYATAELALYF